MIRLSTIIQLNKLYNFIKNSIDFKEKYNKIKQKLN